MNVINLTGKNQEADQDTILGNITDSNTIFIYMGKDYLYNYIDNLKISSKNLIKFRVCKEIASINVLFNQNGKQESVDRLSDLLKLIDLNTTSDVIVLGDLGTNEEQVKQTRTQLSDIMQQLIYLNIPLNRVQVMTEKEHRNIEKVRIFSEKIGIHENNLKESQKRIQSEKFDSYIERKESVSGSLDEIRNCLESAKENELIIAAAASKKSGKSVIVNSMINNELAPTSLELATPNNCIYRNSKNGFTLEYKGEKRQFSDPKQLKKYIFDIFKKAENDHEAGYGIEDMNIGYVAEKRGLSAYTIYDTPGPDLAGAFSHKEAARKAVNLADVVIFSIDYSKYLTDSEFNYLKEIHEIFKKKQKFYSLIINVNKLDCRYGNEGDKSSVRILDFIRNKLINIDPEFRDSIVIGTSALTYFYCLEIEKLKGCAILDNSSNFRDDLEDIIESLADDPEKEFEVTALQFISNLASNLRTFDGIKVTRLEEIKKHSGMPNLLSYIEYIAQAKARTEKVNNLIFKIDNEYTEIQNLFRFQQLRDDLAKNQEQLDSATKILQKFRDEISEIYNEDYYQDINKMHNQNQSVVLKMIEDKDKHPCKIEDILEDLKKTYIDDELNKDKIIDHVVNATERGRFLESVDKLFEETEQTRTIDGVKRKVIREDDLSSKILKIVENIGEDVRKYTEDVLSELTQNLGEENGRIMDVLAAIMNSRLQALKSAIEQCKNSLKTECEIPFDLEVPEFDYSFSRYKIKDRSVELQFDKKWLEFSIKKDFCYHTPKGKIVKRSNWGAAIDSIIRKCKKEGYNRICYDKDYISDTFYEKYIGHDIRGFLDYSNIGELLKPYQEKFKSEVEEFVGYLIKEVGRMSKIVAGHCDRICEVIDHTKDYKNKIENIQKEQEVIQKIHDCVAPFCSEWKENRA